MVALAQYGINYAVASLGTSTPPITYNCCSARPTMSFAVMTATVQAAMPRRALEAALPHDRRSSATLYVLPDGEDPDTLVRKEGKEAFEARMESDATLRISV